jgi:hypothetical protein
MMTEFKEVHEKVFDLSDTRDLSEIEHMAQRHDKFKFLVDETIMLPFRHIRYEVIREEKK